MEQEVGPADSCVAYALTEKKVGTTVPSGSYEL